MIDPITSLAFAIFENQGVFALLLGSGVSRSAQIPTGWEIVLDLTRRVAALEGVDDQEDWGAWYLSRFKLEPDYSTLLDALAGSADERRSILHHYIEATPQELEDGQKQPTLAHRSIARLVSQGFIKVIITTNFDRLIENALRGEGVEPTVIKSDDDLSGAIPLVHSRCHIIKVHGDYLDARIRNTDEELRGYSELLNSLLDRIFAEYGIIVCGWSSDWDHALRAAITRAPSRRYPMYWASRGDPSTSAKDLIAHRQGTLLSISDADSFYEALQLKVSAQAALQQTNPRSVALIVAAAKKYVVRPEFRIQLHDLVAEETKKLRRTLADPGLGPSGTVNASEFRTRVARLEAASEPLARLFGVMGRWGGDMEFDLCLGILRSFGKQRVLGGYTSLIKLTTYPAVLLLYAFGIGALQAGRLKTLYEWFSGPIEKENTRQLSTSVQTLFLWDWAGNDREDWCALEGFEQRKTPLSDHLHNVMSGLLSDLALNPEEFELLFERFEMLGALANVTLVYTREELEAHLARDRQSSARVLMGRLGWHHQGWDSLKSELSQPAFLGKVLAAGFCGGSEAYLRLALLNAERVISRMEWF